MKLKLYMFIAFILLASTFVAAKEINCYSTVNNSWYTTNNTTCDVRLFDVQDLLILTSNFDRTDCIAANTYCEGMDINKDGTVNGFDLRLFTPSLCIDNCTVTEVCGNGVCGATESCFSCAADCGACPVPAKARKSSGGGAPRIINSSNSSNTAIVTLNVSNSTNQAPIDVVLTDAQSTGGSNVNTSGNAADNSKTNDATNAGNSLTGFATSENGGSQKSNTGIAIILIVVVVILIITIVYLANKRDRRKQK